MKLYKKKITTLQQQRGYFKILTPSKMFDKSLDMSRFLNLNMPRF